MNLRLVIVDWIDAYGPTVPWTGFSKLGQIKPHKVQTVGWVVSEDEDYIVLVPSWGDDPEGETEGYGETAIPKGCIKQMRDLTAQ